MCNPLLFDNERDLGGVVPMNKSAFAKAVCAIFSAASNGIGVKGSDAAESIAHLNAAQAFFFSRCHSLQCWRLVKFRGGVR